MPGPRVVAGSMTALLASVFGAAFVGSPHCAGMCGGFVCFVAGQDPRRAPQVAYHLARLAGYLALGGIAGALGSGLDRLGRLGGVSNAAAVVAGAVMIAWGLTVLAEVFGWRSALPHAPRLLRPALTRALATARALPAIPRALVVGLATALLPCGFLYAFVGAAAGTGSWMAGALVMAAFWAGTVPALAAAGWLARSLAHPLRRRLPALGAVLLVALGLLTVTGRLRPDGHAHHPAGHATSPAASHAQVADVGR